MLFAVALLLSSGAKSQLLKYSNLRSQKIAATGKIVIDSLSIVPKSFFVNGYDTSFYILDEVNATLTWKAKTNIDSINISYRVFPYKLNAVAKRFSYDSIINNFIIDKKSFYYRDKQQPSTAALFDFGSMNYNGSFGRSLSFGNSQDVVVNSQFNLQLSGMLADSIQVAAAITDNNIPIQPDGNTQQLNEFDKVWLQFKKKGWEVNLGDIDLRQNKSYFLNFYKRLQGISYSNASSFGKNGSNNLQLSGAIAKGKFTRNIFQGLEGNQGPYRLRGVNNEFYFIVLAGSERVFIDGQVMQRGEDQDYIINYNTAELTFTPRHMITKDSRIQVEFEYAERSYLNAMLYGADEIQVNKKLSVNIAVYNNSDAKNSPINQTLEVKQRQFLSDIGDSTQNAFYPSVFLDTFSVNKILYAQKDSTVSAITYPIYIYSTNPDSAKYSLGFLEVGAGKGNYIPDFNGANGKVYKWVVPLNGVPQGNFEPASFLVTPKKQQLVTVGATYKFAPQTSLLTEMALSNYDINTLSSKNKGDNKGFAGRVLFGHFIPLQSNGKMKQLKLNAGYEVAEQSFKPLERLRTVEFYRDWGLDFQPLAATEHLPVVSIELNDSANNILRLQSSSYIRNDGYKGFRQQAIQMQQIKTWHFNNEINLTNFSGLLSKGYFFRPSFEVKKLLPKAKNYTIGAAFAMQQNEVRNIATDSLTALSFQFNTISAFVKSDITKDNKWAINYFTRSDKLPFNKKMEQVDRSHNINLTTELLKNIHHQFRLNATYRQLQVINPTLTNLQAEKTILGRAEYTINEFSGFITGNVLYEAGAGQEQRRDFSYIEVPAGRGEYTWNDYNADGVPQLNEFEVALFPDQAKYIRVFTPTNQFVKANYTQFNYSFSINPRTITTNFKRKKLADLIGRFNLQSTLQTAKKELSNGLVEFNPFKGAINDTSLITLSNIFTNTFSFNRFSSKWGMDVSNTRNFNKALLTYGFESRKFSNWIMKGRVNFAGLYTFETILRLGYQSLFTPGFDNRNYDIQNISAEPRLTLTQGTSFRLQTSYQFVQKKNSILYGGEKAINNSFTLESKYNAVNNTSLTGKFTYTNINYSGAVNSTVSYIMLDALLPGKNLLWNLDLTKRLGNNLELSFQYEGRKPAETRTIHIGRASLRAIL